MIGQMFDSGAMPVLERMVQFTAARHRHIVHNIANLSTPFFEPTDLSPDDFQQALGKAIDRRRRAHGPLSGPLPIDDTRQLRFRPDGIDPRADATNRNILFHDRNNRSLEDLMKDLAVNTGAHNRAFRLLKNQFDLLQTAIQERV